MRFGRQAGAKLAEKGDKNRSKKASKKDAKTKRFHIYFSMILGGPGVGWGERRGGEFRSRQRNEGTKEWRNGGTEGSG